MTLATIKNVVKRKAGNRNYFFGTLNSSIAREVTYVPVIEAKESFLEQKTQHGYQRPGLKNRMIKYKKYLDENPNRLIPPVILSARGNWKFSGEGSIGSLTIEAPAAIVDGQHRVGGLVALFNEKEEGRDFDFICFEKLTIDEETNEFVTINGEQKGVHPALTVYLKGEEDSKIAWALNTEPNSPFKDKIYRTQADPNTFFALHSMVKNVKATFSHGAFLDLDHEDKLEVLIKFWSIIAAHHEEPWKDMHRKKRDQEFKLLELTGIIAWSSVAPEVLNKGFNPNTKIFDWDKIDDIVKFMSTDVDWSKTGEYQGRTGFAGGNAIAQHLQSILSFYQ